MKKNIFVVCLLPLFCFSQKDFVYKISEKLAVSKQNNLYFLIDKNSKQLSDNYSAIYDFSCNRAVVRQNTLFGYVNLAGKLVIPLQYGKATEFNNNVAYVTQNNRTFFIDTSGIEIDAEKNETVLLFLLKNETSDSAKLVLATKGMTKFKGNPEIETIYNDLIKKKQKQEEEESQKKQEQEEEERQKKQQKEIDDLLARGDSILDANPEGAMKFYKKALEIKPDDNQTLWNIAICYKVNSKNAKENAEKLKFKKIELEYREKVFAKLPDNETVKTEVSNVYGSLSWFYLIAKEYKESIKAAQRGLEIDSSQTWIKTNLALGYVLNNDWKEAEKIYSAYKGKKYEADDSKTWNEIFLKDIEDMEAEGVKHKDFEKVRQLMKE